jgi:ABC-2 type transport system permease protein
MTAQLKAELLKVRSTRTTIALFAAMIALELLIVVLTGLLSDPSSLMSNHDQRSLFAPTVIASIFAGLGGVLLVTSEYRYGTIRPTLLFTPRRTTVVSAKLTAGLATGLVFGAVSLACGIGIGSLILSARGIPSALSGGGFAGLVVGGLVGTALWGAFGVGLGAILRGQVGAVIALLAWDFVFNGLVFGLVPSVGRFLPTPATDALIGLKSAHLLAPAAGGAILLAWTAVLALGGLVLMLRRDVT